MTAIGNIGSITPLVGGDHSDLSSGGKQVSVGDHSSSGSTLNYVDPVQLSDAAKQVIAQQEAGRITRQQSSETNETPAEHASATGSSTSAPQIPAPLSPSEVLSEKVTEAKIRVQGLVGIDGVSEVVDGLGNIDTAALARIQAKNA